MDVARCLLLCLLALLSLTASADETIRLSSFDRFRPTGSAQSSTHTSHGPAGLPSQRQVVAEPAPVLPTTFVVNETAKPELPDLESDSTPIETVTFDSKASKDPLQQKLNQLQQENATAKQEIDAIVTKIEQPQQAVPAVKSPATEPVAVSQSKADNRRLSFSTTSDPSAITTSSKRNSPYTEMLSWRPTAESLTTMGTGLSIVLGLMMICIWVLKRSMPKSSRVLPQEVAEVLGKVILSNRRTAQLLKLGNKLLLVSVTPDGAETLAEITDPEEVQQILLLSDQAQGRGSNAEFEKVFQQLANGPAAEGFLGNEAPELEETDYDPRYDNPDSVHYDAQRLAAAYANTPGGRSNAA